MNTRDAVALIEAAVPRDATTWADVGAGDGTFTRAISQILGPNARIYAIDRDRDALASLRHWAAREEAKVVTVEADFTQPVELPELLDGMLLANTLHFVRDTDIVLARLVRLVRPRGRVVVIEYDRRAASRWVPHPISPSRLGELSKIAGLSEPRIVATRPSTYGGTLYAAALDRP